MIVTEILKIGQKVLINEILELSKKLDAEWRKEHIINYVQIKEYYNKHDNSRKD